MQSCRDVLKGLDKGGANPSLLMARYLKETKGVKDKSDEAIAARGNLFNQMGEAAKNAQFVYSQAFQRRKEDLNEISAPRTFETLAPMAVGLGGSNVIETGLTLNHLYGAPMIPASAIKGVVALYCSTVLGASDPTYLGPALDDRNRPTKKAGELYETLFGKVERTYNADGTVSSVPPEEMSGGYLRFYDAWIEPDSLKAAFVKDVMTPHHSDYYAGKEELPTDFDDPNPVVFMTVQGKFEVRVGCEEPDPGKRKEWIAFALNLTEMALTTLGVGGKIRSAYGRMRTIKSAEETKAEAAQAKAKELKESGWAHAEGETVTVECVNVKEVKGKLKRKFAIAGEASDKDVRFEAVPEAEKGQSFAAKVKRIDKANKAYIMEKID